MQDQGPTRAPHSFVSSARSAAPGELPQVSIQCSVGSSSEEPSKRKGPWSRMGKFPATGVWCCGLSCRTSPHAPSGRHLSF